MIANKNKTPFHWFLISVFIYFTPIIMANIHYVDDQEELYGGILDGLGMVDLWLKC